MSRSILSLLCIFMLMQLAYAQSVTKRTPQLSNEKVKVWQTIIYPSSQQKLALHRHDKDRVVVALNDGTLKVVNDKQQTHYLKLAKGKAYFLPRDLQNEMHTDENISHHPIKVLVIELQ